MRKTYEKKKRDKESTELVAEPKAGRYAKATQEDAAGFADSMSDAFKQSNEKKYFMLLIVAAVIIVILVAGLCPTSLLSVSISIVGSDIPW